MNTRSSWAPHPGTVLVLGGRGRFGLAAVQAFARDGWRVLAQPRPGAKAPQVSGVEWFAGPLDTPDAVKALGRMRADMEARLDTLHNTLLDLRLMPSAPAPVWSAPT